jgi:predicted nucleotidyltransferase
MVGSLDEVERHFLYERIRDVLLADPQVQAVELFGSLTTGDADIYSDIDLRCFLKDGTDRDFAFRLPSLIEAVGPRLIDGWGFSALPNWYVRTFYFAAYPLFWHVDIECLGTEHIDGSDIKQQEHWQQRFKIWIEAVKYLKRGEAQHDLSLASSWVEGTKERLAKRADVTGIQGSLANQLSRMLDIEMAWHRGKDLPVEEVCAACDNLRRALLTGS